MTESAFKRILVVGLGLMGGSFAKALRRAYPNLLMDGMDKNKESIVSALKAGVIDGGFSASQEATYDLVILATPLSAYKAVVETVAPFMEEEALVTDLGSVKGRVHGEMKASLPEGVSFLGGHPMCGSEKSGFAASWADLFLGKSFFLTGEAQGDSVDAYEEMLEAIGAKIVRANAQEHDRIVAKSSHMPQMTAVLLSLLLEGERNAEPYIGSGFRDSTRIAGGDPRVWRDIFRYNAEEMMQNVDALQDQLDRVKIYLETDDGEGLYHMLEAANAVQERIKE